jgi:hypothetical protein
MNLGDLRSRVRDRLAGDQEEDLRYTDDLVDEFLNDGNRDMAVRTGVFVDDTTITLRPNKWRYALPNNCVQVREVYMTDAPNRPIQPITVQDLDRDFYKWRSVTDTEPYHYFIFPGLRKIAFHPVPSTYDVAAVTVIYDRAPGATSLVNRAAKPDIPEQFHEGLVSYAVARFLLLGARTEDRINLARRYMAHYEQILKDCRVWRNAHQDRTHRMDQSWTHADRRFY